MCTRQADGKTFLITPDTQETKHVTKWKGAPLELLPEETLTQA